MKKLKLEIFKSSDRTYLDSIMLEYDSIKIVCDPEGLEHGILKVLYLYRDVCVNYGYNVAKEELTGNFNYKNDEIETLLEFLSEHINENFLFDTTDVYE